MRIKKIHGMRSSKTPAPRVPKFNYLRLDMPISKDNHWLKTAIVITVTIILRCRMSSATQWKELNGIFRDSHTD